MQRIRRRLSWLLMAWLTCQLVALAAPVVLAATGSVAVEELCTCASGDHETCPMHHAQPPAAAHEEPRVCAMTDCCGPADIALLSLAGGAGILPSAVAFLPPQPGAHVAPASSPRLALNLSLDTPPPRR